MFPKVKSWYWARIAPLEDKVENLFGYIFLIVFIGGLLWIGCEIVSGSNTTPQWIGWTLICISCFFVICVLIGILIWLAEKFPNFSRLIWFALFLWIGPMILPTMNLPKWLIAFAIFAWIIKKEIEKINEKLNRIEEYIVSVKEFLSLKEEE